MDSYQAAKASTKLSNLDLLASGHKTLSGNYMVTFIKIKHTCICRIDLCHIQYSLIIVIYTEQYIFNLNEKEWNYIQKATGFKNIPQVFTM